MDRLIEDDLEADKFQQVFDQGSQIILDCLADSGILTSIVYGHMGDEGKWFSVEICRFPQNESLPLPQKANSYIHAVEIAYQEAIRMQWVKNKSNGENSEEA